MPDAAKSETKAGLEAFAAYWFEVLHYSYQSGDTKPLEAVSGPNCKVCNATLATSLDGNAKGRWIVGGKIKIFGTQSDFVKTPAGDYQILIQLKQDLFKVYDSSGRVIHTNPDMGDAIEIMEASFEGGHWTANTLEVMAR